MRRLDGGCKWEPSPDDLARLEATLEQRNHRFGLVSQRLEGLKYRPTVSEEHFDLCVVMDADGAFARFRVCRDDFLVADPDVRSGSERR